jgi:fumarylacetoacetase
MPARPADAPLAPPHLVDAANQADGGLAIRFFAHLLTPRMRSEGAPAAVLTDTRFSAGAWSFEQMITHHAIGGCNLETGDLISSGTLSGEELSSAACLVEITGGKVAFELPNGETRLWLEDGDELAMTARAEREGFVPIGFGACAGEVVPAPAFVP